VLPSWCTFLCGKGFTRCHPVNGSVTACRVITYSFTVLHRPHLAGDSCAAPLLVRFFYAFPGSSLIKLLFCFFSPQWASPCGLLTSLKPPFPVILCHLIPLSCQPLPLGLPWSPELSGRVSRGITFCFWFTCFN